MQQPELLAGGCRLACFSRQAATSSCSLRRVEVLHLHVCRPAHTLTSHRGAPGMAREWALAWLFAAALFAHTHTAAAGVHP